VAGPGEGGGLLVHCLDVGQLVAQLAAEEAMLVRARLGMAEFLFGAAGFVLAMVALGLLRILRGPGDAERMMAAQLLGTGGIASLLLLGAAIDAPATVDVALTLALLTTFAAIAFVKKGTPRSPDADEATGVQGDGR
jgi:multicomponent Na+:H+ antiporter subunit F